MSEDTPVNDPILIDFGKQKRSRVKKLRRGEGRLMNDVGQALAELRDGGEIGKDVQPVIIIVERKARKNGWFPVR